MQKNHISGGICLVAALLIAMYTGANFIRIRQPDVLIKGPGVSKTMMLSAYFEGIKGTNADTEIYVMQGSEPGGKVLILGGTHPNEPARYFGAIAFLERGIVEAGTVYVIPRTNNSAFTHNDPQEGSPQYMRLTTKSGERAFRYGSRATNPIDQWPDPDVYIHAASKQRLSGAETRNINRAYPGRPDGTLTEKNAYAITQMVISEQIDLVFDLHEASPEYPVNNATVSHEKGMNVASLGMFEMLLQGISMSLEPSPANLHGLTHRELGDYTDTIPLLMETANASQGRLRGATSERLALTGVDKYYTKADQLGMLFVAYDNLGHPIEERVGRHLQGIYEYTEAFSALNAERKVSFSGVPTYRQLFSDSDGTDLGGPRLATFLN